MKKGILFLMGLVCLLSSSAFSQELKQNPNSNKDSIIIDLPGKGTVIFVIDELDDLKKIEKVSIDSIVQNLAKEYTGGNVDTAKQDSTKEKKTKFEIGLLLSIGGGLVKNQLSPYLGGRVEFGFDFKKSSLRFGGEVLSSYFFPTDEKKDFMTNTFVGGFISGTSKTDSGLSQSYLNSVGIGFGYLLDDQAHLFEGNTYKASFYFESDKSMFTVIPEIYFTDSFKKIFPGIRVGMSF